MIVTGAGGVFWGVPGFAVTTLFTFLSTYFAMRDRAIIGAFVRSVVPSRVFGQIKNIEMDILSGIADFIRLSAVDPYDDSQRHRADALGSARGGPGTCLGPPGRAASILGPGLFYLPWVIYHFAWGEPGFAVGLLVLYGVVSAFRQVAQTHLVGRELGLHPLVTLISIYAGFRLFGGPGLIYGPLTALLVKGMWGSGLIPHEGGANR